LAQTRDRSRPVHRFAFRTGYDQRSEFVSTRTYPGSPCLVVRVVELVVNVEDEAELIELLIGALTGNVLVFVAGIELIMLADGKEADRV
jgi:hypothetical protein